MPPTPSELMNAGYSFNDAFAVRPAPSTHPTIRKLDEFERRANASTTIRLVRFDARGGVIVFK